MRALSHIDGLEWLRLHYAYPIGLPDSLLRAIAEEPKIVKYLDMPLQHASGPMLKAMRRGITKRRTYEVLNAIRDRVPGIALRTTLLVGHPGETEADVKDLLDAINDIKFERLGVFTYSHEENTHAHTLADDIAQEEKQRRSDAIMEAQMGISEAFNQQLKGQTLKVLFDRLEGDEFVGRTEYDSPEVDNEVRVSAKDNYVRMGDFAQVKITDASTYDLFGEVVKS
jgi:ribosomal protein S12 methylthiotransferase